MKIELLFPLVFVCAGLYILFFGVPFTEKPDKEASCETVSYAAKEPVDSIEITNSESDFSFETGYTDIELEIDNTTADDLVISTPESEVVFNLEDGVLTIKCTSTESAFKAIYVSLMESFGPLLGFTKPFMEINDVVIVYD